MNVVDDEKHLVFECPAFLHLRAARHELFSAAIGDDVKAFMMRNALFLSVMPLSTSEMHGASCSLPLLA